MDNIKGNLSIDSENIFPVIKKWLYSDHDIFFRELISNGCDAITKLKKLEMVGEASVGESEELKINVSVNQEKKTITFTDNGIGMTSDEVSEYINRIAFSGAQDFIEKYKDKTNDDQIIGHFGLGFYSAFMVSGKVTIDTLSYKEGATAVHWESETGMDFEMSDSDKTERGTTITLYLNEDSYEFSNEYRAKEVIEKYCSFMPTPIYFENEIKPEAKEEDKVIDADSEKDADKKAEEKKPEPINDVAPLWTKHPNECKEEDYKKFYRTVFNDYKEPLFWIHLNMDYPFNLKGILYFPKINSEYESIEGTIKLYSNQVFIADNIKEVIPEFLMLLKGVIDCPDLPLNVSRSALQNDGFVKKISDYITKKVADKLSGMFKTERSEYEKFWDDISPFIKFGCLKEEKFNEKMKDFIIYKDIDGKYLTVNEYLGKDDKKSEDNKDGVEKVEAEVVDENGNAKDEAKDVIYYATDLKQQSQYVNMFKENGINAVVLSHNIDQPFISKVEYDNGKIRFQRIDAEITDAFRNADDEGSLKDLSEKLGKLFKDTLKKDKLEVKVEKLKSENIASMITLSEENRRMQDMMKMYSMGDTDMNMFDNGQTLVLNAVHPLVKYISENEESENTEMFVKQLYDLAMLAHKPLDPEAMTEFVNRTNKIMVALSAK